MSPTLDWSRMLAARTAGGSGDIATILASASAEGIITFSGGFPAPETFPTDVLGELADSVLRGPSVETALQYTPTEGLASTRTAIAELVQQLQDTRPDPAGILVTSGGMEGLSLVGRVLLDPGDLALVEAPTYLGAILAFNSLQARVEGVDTDEGGILVDRLEARLAAGERPKLLYAIPDFSNPTGCSLAADRRPALVELCRRYGVLLVEDVAYRELGFAGEKPPSLWSLGPDIVLQLGTFSKIFFPGARLGWAVGPGPVLAAMASAKQSSDQCAGGLGQRLLEGYLAGGHLDRHLKAARSLYASRAGMMLDALDRHLGGGRATWTRPRGGFFVWLTVPGADTTALAGEAVRRGVAYVPGAPFYTDRRGGDQIRLSYSRATDEEIEVGISRLAAVLGGP